jgi:PAS domain S-box-containing protein
MKTKKRSTTCLMDEKNRSDAPSFSFQELFELAEIQSIQDAFAKAAGVASIITDVDGIPITTPSNFCRLCHDIIRKTPEGLSNCMNSDAVIGRYNPDGPVVQTCLSGGLWDAGVSISVGGHHVANWLVGQVKNEKTDKKTMLAYAHKIGADEQAFCAALDEVPTMSLEQFTQVAQALFLIANQLSQLAYQKKLQERIILKQQETEKALTKSEIKYRQIYDNLVDVYYEASLEGIILEISPSIEKHSQYKREDLVGKSLYDLYTNPLERDKLVEILIEQGSVTDYEINLSDLDGTQHICSMNIEVICDTRNIPVKIVGTFRDVTERKQAETALQESEERFRTAFQTGPNAITLTNLEDGLYIDVNEGFTKMLGYSRDEVIGRSAVGLNIWRDIQDRERLRSGLKAHGIVENLEADFKDKEGRIIPGLMSARLLNFKDQDLLLAVTQDLTAIKKTEKEKISAQQHAAEQEKQGLVGEIAGKIAHDFNNILGIVMGNTELALMNCTDADTKESLKIIFDQAIRGRNLTKNLVAFARDQEPKQEFFSVQEKLDLVQTLLKKDLADIEIIKKYHPDVPDLLADPGMIEHAFVNLIQNAIHAVSRVDTPRITFKTYCVADHICIEIEDNGCGIPEEHLDNIYKPSFTLKGSCDVSGAYKSGIKGTGYGMANVKKYIELHRGDILVESRIGSGTKFTIFLPVVKRELTDDEMMEIQEEMTHFGKSILLVEDERAMSDIQYKILTQAPCRHKVDIADNGQTAMDLFDRNPYDFISLDYVLPGKMTGMDVYHYIRQTNKTIPILFVSGNIEFLESIRALKQRDANIDHLSKPCENKEYLYGIDQLLEQTRSES